MDPNRNIFNNNYLSSIFHFLDGCINEDIGSHGSIHLNTLRSCDNVPRSFISNCNIPIDNIDTNYDHDYIERDICNKYRTYIHILPEDTDILRPDSSFNKQFLFNDKAGPINRLYRYIQPELKPDYYNTIQ